MLAWIAVISGLGVIAVAVRWARTAPNVYGRRPPKPWWAGCSLAALCLASGTVAVRQHLREAKLSEVASAVAGRPVKVNCQGYLGSFFDANVEAGYVHSRPDGRPESSTTLKADVCRSLSRYLRSAGDPSMDEVFAVHIVTHEAMHMAGLMDEAMAECAAVQRDAQVARLLGASPAQALSLAERYWIEGYPNLPDAYRTADCGPGGRLDERLADGPWGQDGVGAGVIGP